ncbi:linoleate 9S-lipoxygenase isoform X2 [Cryptomeria japonica]|uniref:linoleate 9S-lipoxygenase isoform X2 n=1 Tax=Cryptomeria japonica TaxID=3369 RepID=UPI0027DA1954|nr:linoleate 9S-lipoxygenase isoform X2 [Cryptomeria japonica]
MDSIRVFGSKNLILESNVQVGSHRCISANLGMSVLGIDKTNQTGFSSLPSLRSNSSFIALGRGVSRSRKVARNLTSKTRIGEPETTTKDKEYEIEGEVVLQKVAFLEFTDYSATLADEVSELTGNKVSLELVSSDQIDPDVTRYPINFKWNSALGFPGGFVIKSMHSREFFLISLAISIPDQGTVRFQCDSWIYPARLIPNDRVFFSNKTFLPDETPVGLRKFRELELISLRGNGTGERKVYDLIYDYDVYNDIQGSETDPDVRREVLGGSQDFPYPRRCRTGRPRVKNAPQFETRASSNFLPPDERFPYRDFADFGTHILTAVANAIIPTLEDIRELAFESFGQVSELYKRGLRSAYNSQRQLREFKKLGQIIKEEVIALEEDLPLINFNRPQVVEVDEFAWRCDEEFARQTLAGVNPLVIQCLQSFPPSSSLDEKLYGPQKSAITAQHIEGNLEGLSVDQATALKRLFILDYYDAYMPYMERINKLSKDVKAYATRTVFFLTKEGTLKPVAIELCLPPIDEKAAVRKVFTPGEHGTEEGALWQLAKAHVRVNDTGYHQLVSHWLTTHCITEPFIIATHRQLSKMHPVFKLLIPHLLDTMDINAAARQSLINAGGIIESGFAPGRYSTEISSKAYKQWKFNEQGLEADLLKRGMAIRDSNAPNGLKLVIEDYPYAVDGIEIWFAIKQWVSDYLSLYYKDDATVKKDKEFQAWWDEIVNVGHADLKDDPSRWYKMNSLNEAVQILTTMIWTASAHHAAVNFGQYSYAGYMPNMPTMSRLLVPEKGTPEYDELLKDPDAYFLKTVSAPKQATIIMAVLEILSKHASHEVYVGQLQGSTMDRLDDPRAEEAFARFTASLTKIEKNIIERNNKCQIYKNRAGPANVPYTLLYPNTTDLSRLGGLTGRGVPNSISI